MSILSNFVLAGIFHFIKFHNHSSLDVSLILAAKGLWNPGGYKSRDDRVSVIQNFFVPGKGQRRSGGQIYLRKNLKPKQELGGPLIWHQPVSSIFGKQSPPPQEQQPQRTQMDKQDNFALRFDGHILGH